MYCRLNIKKTIKILASSALAFSIVCGVLHLDHYSHHEHDGYSVCKIGCDDGHHHSFSHQCDKCLINESDNPIFEEYSKIFFNQKKGNFFNLNIRVKSTITDYTLYSRPPPFPA
tara:strand:+ start:67 stop:408 length:342 start_codon:yes stop_codon:yes gene_type:complete